MKYTIYWCDNNKSAGRGKGKDRFYTDTADIASDREAFMKALSIRDGERWFNPGDYADLNDKELADELEATDIGSGSPVIFYIQKGSKKIYDSGFTKQDW